MELAELGNRFELGGGRRTLRLGPGESLLAFDLLEPEEGIFWKKRKTPYLFNSPSSLERPLLASYSISVL